MTTDTIIVYETQVVQEIRSDAQVVEVVTPGPQGPPGAPGQGGSSFLAKTASYPISGHRAIAAAFDGRAIYADSDDITLASSVLGISIGAASENNTVYIQQSDEMVEPSWNWQEHKPVFCGPNGTLTQTAPTAGFCLILGIATSATSVVVAVKQAIVL
jgi:hypothetical protein